MLGAGPAPLSLRRMHSPELGIEATRGDLVESVHPVTMAVVDASGRLPAASRGELRATGGLRFFDV